MRVLLDEQLDVALRHHFSDDFEVETVEYRGWKSLKNGALMREAAEDYDGFVTNDQSIPHQRNVAALDLRVVVIEAESNEIDDLLPLVPGAEKALREMAPGEVRHVSAPA